MRIFFPIGSLYPSQAGGPSNSIYWLAKALQAKGFQVAIATTNAGIYTPITLDAWLITEYGRVIYVDNQKRWFYIRLISIIFKEIYKNDVLHLTSLFYPFSILAFLLGQMFRKKIIWSVRGELDEQALVYSIWKKKPIIWFLRYFSGSNTVFHTTSPQESQRLRKILGVDKKIIEIPNFLDLPDLIKHTPSKPYLLYIGRIHPKKAIENLINGLSISNNFMYSSFTLKIAGECNNTYGDYLRELVKDLNLAKKVEFLGEIVGYEKQQLYANAYFSILPSHTENFGNVVIESLAQGTPTIASIGTPWKILEDNKIGLWVQNDPQSLSNTLDLVLSFPKEVYLNYRQRARIFIEKNFDIYSNVWRWEVEYKKLI